MINKYIASQTYLLVVVFDRFIVTIALALNFYIMKRHFENENDIHPKSVFFSHIPFDM